MAMLVVGIASIVRAPYPGIDVVYLIGGADPPVPNKIRNPIVLRLDDRVHDGLSRASTGRIVRDVEGTNDSCAIRIVVRLPLRMRRVADPAIGRLRPTRPSGIDLIS